MIGFALENLVFFFRKDIMHIVFTFSTSCLDSLSSSKMLYKMYSIIQIYSYSVFSRFYLTFPHIFFCLFLMINLLLYGSLFFIPSSIKVLSCYSHGAF